MSFLYDSYGNRKYITLKERRKFLRAARAKTPVEVSTFCTVLAFTGARLSEVLELTPRQVDFEAGVIVIRSLKKRRKDTPIYRAIPVPGCLLDELDLVHGIKVVQHNRERADARLWPWCRTTGWTRTKEVMRSAGITGLHASPKGLRHGFAIAALEVGVPLNMVRKWLGHARLKTTAIYTEAVGAEERRIARRMWGTLLPRDRHG